MIYSMTGYGEAAREIGHKAYRIEIKSLNGKNADIRFKSNASLRDKEIILRKLITEMGMRGKFEVNLNLTSEGAEDSRINQPLMSRFYEEISTFAKDKGIGTGDILQSLIRLPNVVQMGEDVISDEEWEVIRAMAEEAVTKLNQFRKTEGASMEKDLNVRVNNILSALESVPEHEAARIEHIKARIRKNLNEHLKDENLDENRFEQELLFYLERLDINEEKVRLRQHCEFFIQEVAKEAIQKGRKLNFISQEIGREINTLGAKAQHSEIQKMVVRMKDELEKMKEQILNIL